MYQTLILEDIKDNQNFKDNFFWNRIFFKGITSDKPIEDYLLFKKDDYTRESKTLKEHGNLYNMLINELPSWQSLPLRKESVIFTNDYNVAKAFAIRRPIQGKAFAKLFMVVPIKSARIIVSPESDLWYSFSPFIKSMGINKYIYTLTDFNATFKDLASYFDDQDFDMSLENFSRLISEIKSKKIETSKMNPYTKIIYEVIVDPTVNYIEKLNNNFSPEFNKFQIVDTKDVALIKKNCELWTNDESILVEFSKFDDLVNLIGIDFKDLE